MHILIVDDDLVSRKKLEALLGPYGSCELASSGEEALNRFQSALETGEPFELVTLDIEMPGQRGPDVLRQMRSIESRLGPGRRTPPAHILMVTAMSDQENVLQSIQAGCEHYLIKPFNPEKISAAFAQLGITAPPTTTALPTSGTSPETTRRLLAVDDEVVSQAKLKLLLNKFGQCEGARSGSEALSLFLHGHEKGIPLDFMALDQDLPDFLGTEVLRKIRTYEAESARTRSIPLLQAALVTAQGDQVQEEEALSLGCRHFFRKPFDRIQLEKCFSTFLSPARILLVDENLRTGVDLRRLLGHLGDLRQVSTLEQARSILAQPGQPEFDLVMHPLRLDDRAFLRAGKGRHVALIRQGSREDAENALKSGYSAFLPLPVDADGLEDALFMSGLDPSLIPHHAGPTASGPGEDVPPEILLPRLLRQDAQLDTQDLCNRLTRLAAFCTPATADLLSGQAFSTALPGSIRICLIRSLARTRNPLFLRPLLNILREDPEPSIRIEAAAGLLQFRDLRVLSRLSEWLPSQPGEFIAALRKVLPQYREGNTLLELIFLLISRGQDTPATRILGLLAHEAEESLLLNLLAVSSTALSRPAFSALAFPVRRSVGFALASCLTRNLPPAVPPERSWNVAPAATELGAWLSANPDQLETVSSLILPILDALPPPDSDALRGALSQTPSN